MKNLEVVFDKSIDIESYKVSFFDEKKQIVFVWRSNVGKSSLLNAVFQKKDLVKTSSMPGKTRTANLFKVNNKYHFVDLPWYGFAKRWEIERDKLDALISWYLEEFKSYIQKVVIVIDTKIWPTQSDIDMFKFLQEFSFPILVASNKIDKLSKNEVQKSLLHSQEIFFWQEIMWVSARKNIWIDEMRRNLLGSLK